MLYKLAISYLIMVSSWVLLDHQYEWLALLGFLVALTCFVDIAVERFGSKK